MATKIIIVGAGIIGITSAYILAKRGYEVQVIEQNPGPAERCSFSNAGQISYSHAEPWANFESIKLAMKWLGRDDAPLLLNMRLDYRMWHWISAFLLQAMPKRVHKNTRTMMRLGLYSKQCLEQFLQEEEPIDFSYASKGILHVFHTKRSFKKAKSQQQLQAELGAPNQVLSPTEIIQLEPSLAHLESHLSGGFLDELDAQGDIYYFTKALAARAETMGVTFHYDTAVTDLVEKNGKIIAVETDKDTFACDKAVICLGAKSSVLLRQKGISVPIYPMKGYSISVPLRGASTHAATERSITDEHERIVFTRLGDILRVAGTAEFAGYDESVQHKRILMLKRAVRRFFPDIPQHNLDYARQWACLRPSTPDGPPIIGATKRYPNLYLNTGHGTLGWTQSFASMHLLADMIDGTTPAIDTDGLLPTRYGV